MSAPIRVRLSRAKGWRMPDNTVKVTRPSIWGNPFPVDHEGTWMHCLSLGLDGADKQDRQRATVDLFKRWINNGKVNEIVGLFLPEIPKAPALRIIKRDLGGKNLACWCPIGTPCHADVLLDLANAPPADSTSPTTKAQDTQKDHTP